MSDGHPSLTPARLITFAIGLVGVPIFALSVLVYDIATDPTGIFLNVIVPAVIGGAIGILMVRSPSVRTARIRKGSKWERAGVIAVSLAALVGVLGNDLPRWLNAGVEGWVVGFFFALDLFLMMVWRNDPELRRRIASARSSQS